MEIRYSQLAEFISCPLSYKRRYIDGIQDTEKSSALEFGTALHTAIKGHFDGLDGIELFKIYWESLQSTPMIYYRHNWDMLADLAVNKFLPNFFRLHAKHYVNPIMEETCKVQLFDDVFLTGTFDMCSQHDGLLTLSDWKTASSPYKKEKILRNPQMYIYSKMYESKYGKLPEKLQYKVFCKSNGGIQTLETELTKEKLDLQMESVSNIIKTMLNMIKTNQWYHNFDCWCKE